MTNIEKKTPETIDISHSDDDDDDDDKDDEVRSFDYFPFYQQFFCHFGNPCFFLFNKNLIFIYS